MEDVIEESKAPIVDEFVDSEEEEQIKKEEEQEKSDSSVRFTQLVPKFLKAIIVCEQGNAQALTKLIFNEKLVEIGKGETIYKEKTIDTLKIYYVEEFQLLIIHTEQGLKSSFYGQLSEQFFGQLQLNGSSFQHIIILASQYKTTYSTTDTGHVSSIGDTIPIKYYKTSFASKDQGLAGFVQNYQPAGVLNIYGGFGASMLVHAEMNGMPAACFMIIVDSHFVTSENLQAYAPIFNQLLGLNIDFSDMTKYKNFRAVLKEENTRGHNIFN